MNVVSINSLLLKIKALNFAWGVFRKQSFEIRRKNRSFFFFLIAHENTQALRYGIDGHLK